MAYFDQYGVEYSDDLRTLVRCPQNFCGLYKIIEGVECIGSDLGLYGEHHHFYGEIETDAPAFRGCAKLTNVILPVSVKTIGYRAFSESGIKSIIVPRGVQKIEVETFKGCNKLTAIILPHTLKFCGTGFLSGCNNVKEICIPEGFFNIYSEAIFEGKAMCAIECDRDELYSLSCYEYEDCPQPYKTKKDRLVYFSNDNFTLLRCNRFFDGEFRIPLFVKKIGRCAFAGCKKITKIVAHSGIEYVGDFAFDGCENLLEISITSPIKNLFLQAVVPLDIIKIDAIRDEKEKRAALIKSAYYLFFDTETTGLPLYGMYNAPPSFTDIWPRLVQLAWILTDEQGKEIKSRNCIIYPSGFTIPQDAVDVHYISTERAKREGLKLSTVLDDFLQDLDHAIIIVGHNIGFDKCVVSSELCRMGVEYCHLMDKSSICTMEESTNFCQLPNNYGYRDYKWPKLSELYEKLFSSQFTDTHNAIADIKATKKCFFELKKRGII